MSKKPTKQSRMTARRKARQEAAMERFRKAQVRSLGLKNMGQGELRDFLLQVGVPFRHLAQRSKQAIMEKFG